MLDLGQGDRHLHGRRTDAPQGAEEIILTDGKGEEVEGAELLGAEHDAHRRIPRRADQARSARGTAHRVHPPGEVVVAVIPEQREDDVPALAVDAPHGPREIGDGVHLQLALVRPLAKALQHARVVLPGDENPHGNHSLLAQRGGGRRRSGRFQAPSPRPPR
jgi:hypothetical protein